MYAVNVRYLLSQIGVWLEVKPALRFKPIDSNSFLPLDPVFNYPFMKICQMKTKGLKCDFLQLHSAFVVFYSLLDTQDEVK